MNLRSICFFFVFIFLCSCNHSKIEVDSYGSKLKAKWVNHKVEFPESLVKLNKNINVLNSNFTLFVFYDGSCSFCYVELAKWRKMTSIFEEMKVELKFVLAGTNIDLIKFHLKELNFKHENVFFDSNNV